MSTTIPKLEGFCDLCLADDFPLHSINYLINFGYKRVAVNQLVDESAFEPKKKKKKGEIRENPDIIPLPIDIPEDITKKIKVLHRVTLEFSDSSVAHKMNQSENLKKYDLIAVIPKTIGAFQYASSSMDIDIISFQSSSKLPFKLNRKLYRQATERGIFFELMYSPAIKDSTARKNIINTAHLYHAMGKSRNILLTSWAENLMQVRGPYDVINLGLILGLNEHQCRTVLTSNAHKAIIKGDCRRRGKALLFIKSSENFITNDQTQKEVTGEPDAKKIKVASNVSTDLSRHINLQSENKLQC